MPEPTLEQLKEKSAQAYQVIAYMDEAYCEFMTGSGEHLPLPEGDEVARAMDYFCDPDAFDEEFLPWPRFKKPDASPA